MKILVSIPGGLVRRRFLTEGEIEKLTAGGEVVWNPTDNQYTEEELVDAMRDADVIITGWHIKNLQQVCLRMQKSLSLFCIQAVW